MEEIEAAIKVLIGEAHWLNHSAGRPSVIRVSIKAVRESLSRLEDSLPIDHRKGKLPQGEHHDYDQKTPEDSNPIDYRSEDY